MLRYNTFEGSIKNVVFSLTLKQHLPTSLTWHIKYWLVKQLFFPMYNHLLNRLPILIQSSGECQLLKMSHIQISLPIQLKKILSFGKN